MTGVVEISRTHNPFTRDGIRIDENAVPHNVDLPESLLVLLRSEVEAAPEVEAVVEVDSERLTYRQLWDRAARVAGGLRARGVDRGDRVAVRYRAGTDWVLAFWGTLMAGGLAVAVNTGRSASRSTSCRLSGPRGRPYGWGITVGGAAVAEHMLRCLLAEADLAMGLNGYRSVADLSPDVLVAVPAPAHRHQGSV